MNKEIKNTFKITSNILIYIVSILMVLTVWLENGLIGYTNIALSVIAIVITVLSISEISIKKVLKEMNIYYFIVSVVITLSKIIDNNILFYIGIGLFVIVLIMYILVTINENKKVKK